MPKKNTSAKEILKSPKGMRDIIGNEYYRYQGLFEKAQEIALYYGFKPIETPVLEKEEIFARGVGAVTDIVEKEMYTVKTKGGDKLVLRPEGTAGIMRAYIEKGMQTLPQPVMLYYSGSFFRHEKPQHGRYREFKQFGLEILGTEKSIADAIIMRTTIDILEEVGFKNLCIDVNSIGDSECRPNYIRALTAYYKKHIDKLCPHCKKRIKDNPLRLLDCKDARCQVLKEDAPESISSLCAGCKKHFKEVLEYLDSTDVPYKINNTLVRGLDYYTRTVFEISESPEENPIDNTDDAEDATSYNTPPPLALAGGGRYDNLAKTLGHNRPISAVGVSLGMDRIIMADSIKSLTPRIIKKPKIYFIQLGFEAKLQSLTIIEMLRKARIPIAQSLSKDSLSAQLATAEKMNIPYTIIFGQKEAMDGTVIMRNMDNRSQETIKLENLAEHIRKMK